MHLNWWFIFWTQSCHRSGCICFCTLLFLQVPLVMFSSDFESLSLAFWFSALFISSQNHVDYIPFHHKDDEDIHWLKHVHHICEVPTRNAKTVNIMTKHYRILTINNVSLLYFYKTTYQLDFDVESVARPEMISKVHIKPNPRKSFV